MSEETFTFTTDMTEKLIHMRLQNEWLFKKKKQPWKDFYKILLDNGFPRSMKFAQMTKKWQNLVGAYKEAKKKNNTFFYYNIFEKYSGANRTIDKYDLWDEEWQLKLIEAYRKGLETTDGKTTSDTELWRAVESELRANDLPLECCIQDIHGLFHHLKQIYYRRCASGKRKAGEPWALHEGMRAACGARAPPGGRRALSKAQRCERAARAHASLNFKWAHDLTESFIQIRLQHQWLFKERKQPWHDFSNIMVENGYPKLSHEFIQRKWNTVFRDYQKAQASNNTSWIYYDLFQKYSHESSCIVDPLQNWQEHWVLQLIHSRTRHHNLFHEYASPSLAWREVERDLRSSKIPLDHSLLCIAEQWEYLKKTFKCKSGFAAKGILKEPWPFYNAMESFFDLERKNEATFDFAEFNADYTQDGNDSFDEEDIKPLSRVKRLEENESSDKDDEKSLPRVHKVEVAIEQLEEGAEVEPQACRACGARGACADVWDELGGVTVAEKLSAISGIQVQKSDGLPDRICVACLKQLAEAYQFRIKCQQTEKRYRITLLRVKKESLINDDTADQDDDSDTEADVKASMKPKAKTTQNKERKPIKRKSLKSQQKRNKEVDRRICEICGRNVLNVKIHVAAHSGERIACGVCGKTFKYRSSLLGHRATHGGTPVKVCQVCGKSFNYMYHYRRHFARHADERRFRCDQCGKRFNSADVLRVHARIHTRQLPYGCPECGRAFRTSGCVARHRRLVHKIRGDPLAPRSFKLPAA